jgi:hypothetical protein
MMNPAKLTEVTKEFNQAKSAMDVWGDQELDIDEI